MVGEQTKIMKPTLAIMLVQFSVIAFSVVDRLMVSSVLTKWKLIIYADPDFNAKPPQKKLIIIE